MYSLDTLQEKAVKCTSQNTLIIAAPGSGKTTVIINRIIYLIKNLMVAPKNIVVITFTRAAAENMKNRYLKLSEEKSIPYFGTMHSLFYKILRKYNSNIKIIDEAHIYRLVNKVLLTYLDTISEEKIKEAINDISMYKTSNQSLEKFCPSIDKGAFLECFKEYEDYKRKNELIDFDDLQLQCKTLLLKDRAMLSYYREKFKYILIDEFQDSDDIQIEILKLLSYNNSIFAVGDEDQSIYGFRGSKPQYMVEFNKIFKNSEVLFLEMNYRSPQNLVETSNRLISRNLNRNPKTIKAYKNYSRAINIVSSGDEGDQAETISNILLSNKDSIKDSAIIYRTNRECSRLIDIFIKKGIPFNLLDKGYNFYEHFICKDLIAYIKLSFENRDKNSFIRIANKPYRYLSKLNLERLNQINIKGNVFDLFCDLDKISMTQLKEIKKLKKSVNKIKKHSIISAIRYIIKNLSYYRYVEEYSLKNKIDHTVLESIIEAFISAGKEFISLEEFLLHIESVKQNLGNNKDTKSGVILSSIHGVKGMEFKNLFIINCNCDNIPYLKSDIINIEEERRLFYVAITRTIENLWICYNEFYNGVKKKPSFFIEECGLIENDAN
ncbi:MAG: ATP-dependent helicase [Clostridiaceae bacterium]|nr:ATP-dependent helicase [Clostridiaceae bacterium]